MHILFKTIVPWMAKVAKKPVGNWVKNRPSVRRRLNKLGIDRVTAGSPFERIYSDALAEYEKDKPRAIRELFRNPEIKKIFRGAFVKLDKAYFYREAWEHVQGKIEHIMRALDLDPLLEYDSFFEIFDRLVIQSRTPWQEQIQHTLNKTRQEVHTLHGDLAEERMRRAAQRDLATPFVSPKQYYAPWLVEGRLFNQLATLVGRKDFIDGLIQFAEHGLAKVLVLTGRGGIGKSKILYEFCNKFNPSRQIRFISEVIPLKAEDFAELTNGDYLLVLDDAHKFDEKTLGLLLLFVRDPAFRLKLVLSSRPQGVWFLKSALSRAGFDSQEVVSLPELSDLTLDEVREIARQTLGSDLEYLVDRLARLTKDCPLVTVVGGRLLRDRSVDPTLLERDEDFRGAVLNKFEDVLVGDIGTRVEADVCRRILCLLAAVSPFIIENGQFFERACSFLDIEEPELLDIVDELEVSGVVVRRGRTYHITPDVLSDHILHQACVRRNGMPSGFATRVYERFSDICPEQVLRNLAELDWRLTTSTGKDTILLDAVWQSIYTTFHAGTNWNRIQVMEQVQRVAYYQSRKALELAEYAFRNPLPMQEESTYYNQERILDEVADVLKNVGYNLDFLPKCCDLLWEIGRDDERPTNKHPSHGIKVLKTISAYSSHKYLSVQLIVLDAVERWLTDQAVHNHVYSPFEMIKPMFGKVGEETSREGFHMIMRPFLVDYDATRSVRNRALELLKRYLFHQDVRVTVRAIDVLEAALAEPMAILNMEIPLSYTVQWVPQQMAVLKYFEERIQSNPDPYVCIAIGESIWWHARFSSCPTVMEKAREILRAIPSNFEFRFIRALCFSVDKDWLDDHDDFAQAYHEQQQRANDIWAAIVHEYMANMAGNARLIVSDLGQRLGLISDMNLPNNPQLFMSKLADVSASLTEEISRIIIEDDSSMALVPWLVTLLFSLRFAKPDLALRCYQQAIKSPRMEIQRVAASYLSRTCLDHPNQEEMAHLEALISHPDPFIVNEAFLGMKWYGQSDPDYLVETIMGIDIGDCSTLAAQVCSAVADSNSITLAAFTDPQLIELLMKMRSVNNLADESVGRFLRGVSQRIPEHVVEFLLDRIKKECCNPGGDLEAIPYTVRNYGLPVDENAAGYVALLRSIRDRTINFAVQGQWDAAALFKQVSHGFNDRSLEVLTEWIDTEEQAKIETVLRLLKDADGGFVLSRVEFVSYLLETSIRVSQSCYETAVSYLSAIAVSGPRHGLPGQPNPQDQYMQNQATTIAKTFFTGSAQERFYTSLAQDARGRIEKLIALDEELFDD